jgi:DNA-binding Lrp family transcriptional regulator
MTIVRVRADQLRSRSRYGTPARPLVVRRTGRLWAQLRRPGRVAVKVRGNAEADGGNVPPPQLDDVDLEILRLLRVDARRSARAIARDVGMSPGAVNERLTRLENSGVIRGYHADIDPVAPDLRDAGLDIQVEHFARLFPDNLIGRHAVQHIEWALKYEATRVSPRRVDNLHGRRT